MKTKALFRQLAHTVANNGKSITVTVDGEQHSVDSSMSVAAALLTVGPASIRTNVADGAVRGPYCMMGVCFECLVEVNGVPNVQSCMMKVADGMVINTISKRS